MIKEKREMIIDIWKTNPFAIAWKEKLNKNKIVEEEKGECQHICTSNCRRVGCNCNCGEYHCEECHGLGIITKTEWSGTDDSYDVEVKCHCQED